MPETKKAISITLKRKGLDIVMDIKTAPEIEAYFAKASKDEGNYDDFGNHTEDGVAQTKTSSKWVRANGEGLNYYVKNVRLGDKFQGYRIMDNFGNGLMEETGKFNLAFLRTVGITNGVTIKTTDLLSVEEMKQYIQKLADWTKKFYETILSESEVIATVSVDVAEQNEVLANIE